VQTEAGAGALSACAPCPRRGAWGRLGVVLAAGLCGAALVVAISRSAPPPERAPFNARPLEQLRAEKPAVVFVGNSMVLSRIDPKRLSQLLAPRKAQVVATGGSESAAWYLMLKNYVAAAGYRPDRVVVFFRNAELTLPRLRTEGRYALLLERASPADDPVVAAKLAPRFDRGLAYPRWLLGRIAPTARREQQFARAVDEAATRIGRLAAIEPSGRRRKNRINGLFAVGALRASRSEPTPEFNVTGPFAEAVGDSFLPEILALAKEQGIPLAFVRVRRRAVAEGRPESREMEEYIRALRGYVEREGALFVDMNPAAWESPDLYGIGDHIAREHLAEYTQRFFEHAPELFRP
jgi:hypothetical protein